MKKSLPLICFLFFAYSVLADTHYVNVNNASPAAPYTSWATAATVIQDAVDAATAGDVVLVTNGVYNTGGKITPGYDLSNRVFVSSAISVRSVNGPGATVIVGEGPLSLKTYRCVYLVSGAELSGFTLSNGFSHSWTWGEDRIFDRSGGGAFLFGGGVVSNCIISENEVDEDGGGVYCSNGGFVVDCIIQDNYADDEGGGVCCLEGGAVQYCAVVSNEAWMGGGVYCEDGGEVNYCLVGWNNSSYRAGGVYLDYGGMVANTTVRDNIAGGNGGGIYSWSSGGISNCAVYGNWTPDDGGGGSVYDSPIINCTFIGNAASGKAGGIFLDTSAAMTVANTIIYHNEAIVGANYFIEDDDVELKYCCATPAASGEGNISAQPLVAGMHDPHIISNSPCINAGSNAFATGISVDIDDEQRINGAIVEIGADEYWSGGMTGALSVAIITELTNAVVENALTFISDVRGKAQRLEWRVQTNGGTKVVADLTEIEHTWFISGNYSVELFAYNNSGSASASVSVEIIDGFTNYVWKGGGHISPYTSWASAATNIQSAVDAAAAGGVVIVTNDEYVTEAEIAITKPLTVKSVNGAAGTIINGNDDHRGFRVDDPNGLIDGFTITNCNVVSGDGGGAKLNSGGRIVNSTIIDCRADGGGAVACLAGGVVSNCNLINNVADGYGHAGGAVFCNNGGEIFHCLIEGNEASNDDGGGVFFQNSGRASYCKIINNYAETGGGAYCYRGGYLLNCVISNNIADNESTWSYGGGGVQTYYGGEIVNCLIANNLAYYLGGGVYLYEATARNCTIINNEAYARGGGVYSYYADLENSIVYYNKAILGENYRYAGSIYFTNCCVPNPVSWAVNTISDPPMFSGINDSHLSENSPCINAGDNALAHGVSVDCDGEPRINGGTVDIGWDEFVLAGITGNLSAEIIAVVTNAIVNVPLEFTADVHGKILGKTWTIENAGSPVIISNDTEINYSWDTAGSYEIILRAWNSSESASATVTVQIVEGMTNYVDVASSSPVSPYSSWATAATSIYDAVSVAPAGGFVLVSSGVYWENQEILINKKLFLVSVSGPENTIIDGGDAHRCVNISADGSLISGFTITNGNAGNGNGGGVVLHNDDTIEYCVLTGNKARYGGGAYLYAGGTVTDCIARANFASQFGGGVACYGGGLIVDSTIITNKSTDDGGGIYAYSGGTVRNCNVENNITTYNYGYGAGIYFYYAGGIYNSNIRNNNAQGNNGDGGGVFASSSGPITNCLIVGNQTDGDGGGVAATVNTKVENCVITNNAAEDGGGGVYISSGARLENCIVAENRQTIGGGGGGIYLNNGGVVNKCEIYNNTANGSGGGARFRQNGIITNCILYGNTANDWDGGGGVMLDSGGRITHSEILNNSAKNGGGISSIGGRGIATDCLIAGNKCTAGNGGGGVYIWGGGSVNRCIITNNISQKSDGGAGGGIFILNNGTINNSFIGMNISSNNGGGIGVEGWGGTILIQNCTVRGNLAYNEGGGAFCNDYCFLRNTILHDNLAPFGNNYFNRGGNVFYEYCCSTPAPTGEGNFSADPLLVGKNNPHILPDSPCRDAGTNAYAQNIGPDIDGENRINPTVDIGCDEYISAGITGALAVAIIPSDTTAVTQVEIIFDSDVLGKADQLIWQFNQSGSPRYVTNQPTVSHSWNSPGNYDVILYAFNSSGSAADTVTVYVIAASTNYVSKAGSHVAPFSSWATAATNIIAAVDAAMPGALVLVETGVYKEATAVYIDKPLSLVSFRGWENTVIDGYDTHRCAFLFYTNTLIEGFTLRNGNADDSFQSGGAAVIGAGGIIRNCFITQNKAAAYGGGALLYYSGELINCHVISNSSYFGGGALCYYGGDIVNCTIVNNTAYAHGGGVHCEFGGDIRNSIMYYNNSALGANYYNTTGDISYAFCCTTPAPDAEYSGGGNMAIEPQLVGINNPHLLSLSPCRGQGLFAFATNIPVDIDYEKRTDEFDMYVDIGCDQYVGDGITGMLTADIIAPYIVTAPGLPLEFISDVHGKASWLTWKISTNSGWRTENNSLKVSQAWDSVGSNTIILTANNNSGSDSATVTVYVTESSTNYVAKTGAHIPPFNSWATAATNIQAAVNAAVAGNLVIVSNGVYKEGSELLIEKSISLTSLNGANSTIIDGENSYRCCRVEETDAIIDGFTFRNGDSAGDLAGEGGGGLILVQNGFLKNSIIRNCHAAKYGGGVICYGGGTVSNCLVFSNSSELGAGVELYNDGLLIDSEIYLNTADTRGGGIEIIFNGLVTNCYIHENDAWVEGGGVGFYQGGKVIDCTLYKNNSVNGGGAFFYFDGLMKNSKIISNTVWNATAGVRFYGGGTLENSLVAFNEAPNYGGGVATRFGGTIVNCTIAQNIDNAGISGGVYCQNSGTYINNIIFDNIGGNVGNASAGFFAYCCSSVELNGKGNILSDPLFLDSAAGDFHLKFNSPVIDKGNSADAPLPTDLDGNQRLLGCAIDIGCYEYPFAQTAALQPPSISYPVSISAGSSGCTAVTNQQYIFVAGQKSNGCFVINSGSTNDIFQSYDDADWTNINVALPNLTNYFCFRTISNDMINISAATTTLCVINYAPMPFVKITNAPAMVKYSTFYADVSGTNNYVVSGNMIWSNHTANTGGVATRIAPENLAWTASIPLAQGSNDIAVFAWNVIGQSANDVVSIYRKTWIESAPRIATNALIFPCAAAQLLAPFPTNITWLVDKITDETDGTNLVITKISVHLAGNSNEVANVTNDISNLLGEISWLVPESLIGNETNYVLRFEIVDSESLTNSRIFTDNEFTIIPEPCFYSCPANAGVLFIILLFINRKFVPKHFTIGMNL